MLKQSEQLKVLKNTIKLSYLERDWLKNLEEYIEGKDHLRKHKDRLLKEAPDEIKKSLQLLVSRGIFSQGMYSTCKNCGYKDWIPVDNLLLFNECQICNTRSQTPVNFDWEFYLNDFLAYGIREQGILPVVLTLGLLSKDSKDCFLYSSPLNLYNYNKNESKFELAAEVDLICVVDGKLILGEVKTSLNYFSKKELAKLKDLALQFEPDIVLISSLKGETSQLDDKIIELRSLDCEIRGLSRDNFDSSSRSFHLPY